MPLTTEPQLADLIVSGDPQTGSHRLAAVGGLEVGVWTITPGASRDVEADEVFVVLSGEGTIRFEDGEEIQLGPGTAVRLRAGDRTLWTIKTTLRKLYVA